MSWMMMAVLQGILTYMLLHFGLILLVIIVRGRECSALQVGIPCVSAVVLMALKGCFG